MKSARPRLRLRQVTVLKVGGDHAPVVRPVPRAGDRVIGEGHPVVHCPRRGRAGKVPAQAHCLAAVTKDALVNRTPPRTTRTVTERDSGAVLPVTTPLPGVHRWIAGGAGQDASLTVAVRGEVRIFSRSRA